jgi:hypothetical protein
MERIEPRVVSDQTTAEFEPDRAPPSTTPLSSMIRTEPNLT